MYNVLHLRGDMREINYFRENLLCNLNILLFTYLTDMPA